MTTQELVRPTTAEPAQQSLQALRRFGPMAFLQLEIDRVFDRFDGFRAWTWPSAFAERAFSPKMEVVETDNALEVATELPGLDKRDIEISVGDGMLTIRGEKKTEKDERKKNYRVVERSYGAFERAIAVPEGVDASKVKAKMSKGVLKVEVPKPAAAKAQQVKITAE